LKKKILKITDGVKQLTFPPSGSELFHARERYTVRHSCQPHQSWICGYVHSASGNSSQVISSLECLLVCPLPTYENKVDDLIFGV
jgi:hypothetical protein